MNFEEALKPLENQNQQQQQNAGGAGDQQQQQGGTPPPAGAENQPPAGGAEKPPVAGEQNQQQQQLPNQNSTAGAPPAANTEEQQRQQKAYNDYLDKMSGSKIKDEAAFKAILPVLDDYPVLKKQHEELAAKMASAPVFVDDEVRIFNDLKANGASKEQINTFLKLGQLGDLKDLSDRDAIIANMIMLKGTKESAAGYKIDRDFKIGDESVSEQEREILDDDLRIAGENARQELDKFKTTVSQPALEPEEVRLQQQANTMAHQAVVKPYVQEVVQSIPHLGLFNLSGKDGAETVPYEMPLDDDGRKFLGQMVENYFMDGLTPVTEESTREALNYARAEYWRTNAERVMQSVFDRAVSLTTEKLVNKYENRSGLQNPQENPIVQGGNDAVKLGQFVQQIASRTT